LGHASGGELDPAEDVRRRCMKNSPSVLFGVFKTTREGYDRGNEVWIVYSGRDREGPVYQRIREGIWQKREL